MKEYLKEIEKISNKKLSEKEIEIKIKIEDISLNNPTNKYKNKYFIDIVIPEIGDFGVEAKYSYSMSKEELIEKIGETIAYEVEGQL